MPFIHKKQSVKYESLSNIKIKKLLNYFHEKNLRSFKFYQVDLAEESELNRAILQIKNLSTIDVLINNAGALFLKKKLLILLKI